MKALVVGLGSMGKRRIRNLQRLGVEKIAGLDLRADRRDEAASNYTIETFDAAERAYAWKPDAIVCSTPPDLHLGVARAAVERGIPVFTEAGVSLEGLDDLERIAAAKGVLVAPSCTLRYFAAPKKIREWVRARAIGRPLSFVYQSGQWLPDWHPWEDYRTFYVSRRETGACREIVPFELTWLCDIFGDVQEVQAFAAKLSALEAPIEDVYQGLYRFASGVAGMLQVDVLARVPVRHFHLLGSEGSIEWDAGRKEIRLFTKETGEWKTESLATGTVEPQYAEWAAEEPYVEEMGDFLAAVKGERPWPNPLASDRRVLEALLAAEESHATGRRVWLGPGKP